MKVEMVGKPSQEQMNKVYRYLFEMMIRDGYIKTLKKRPS